MERNDRRFAILKDMAKILLLIAQEGFQTKEYHDPKRVLLAAGHTVVTASVDSGNATFKLKQ